MQLERLDALLTNDSQLRSSRLAWLRAIPEAVAASSLVAVLARLDHVRAVGLDPALATTIDECRFRQLVREGAVAPAYMIGRFSRLRRRATLTAQILELQVRLTDAAIDLFDKLVGTLFAKGRRGRQRRYQASAGDVCRLMGLFGGTISALQAARERDADPFELLDETVGWWRLLQAKPQVNAFAELAKTDPLPAAGEKYATLRRFAPIFIDRIELQAATGSKSLLAAVTLLRELNRTGRRDVPADAPMPFTSRAWKRLVRSEARKAARSTAASTRQPSSRPCGTGCAPATFGSTAHAPGGASTLTCYPSPTSRPMPPTCLSSVMSTATLPGAERNSSSVSSGSPAGSTAVSWKGSRSRAAGCT
jgi:hypothetical protein